MDALETEMLLNDVASVVKLAIERAVAPLSDRLDGLERQIKEMPTPRDGKDADAEQIASTVTLKLDADLSEIRGALDEIDKRLPNDIKSLVDAAVAESVSKIPVPVDLSSEFEEFKKSVGQQIEEEKLWQWLAPKIPEPMARTEIEAIANDAVKAAISSFPTPQDGKSITVDDVAPMIAAEVEKRVSELPKPKDGKDGIDGKDGLDVSDLFRAEGGKLIAVMSDGRTKDLGVFVGKDGEPGKDGQDGVGFDDLSASYDGEKTITIRFSKGDRVKEFDFAMPVVIDRGVFKDGSEYKAGDGVTWGGSFWIAQKDTGAKPDTGSDWRLSVKRGRDGKDGIMKDAQPNAPVRVGTPAQKE